MPGTNSNNGSAKKILAGVLVVLLAGAVSSNVITWGQVQVHTSRLDAGDREATTVAEKLDRFVVRLQRIEREVVEANAKLDTMLKNQNTEHKP